MASEEEILMAEVSGRFIALGLFDEADICSTLWVVATAARDWLRAPPGKPATDAESVLTKAVADWNQTRIDIFKKRNP